MRWKKDDDHSLSLSLLLHFKIANKNVHRRTATTVCEFKQASNEFRPVVRLRMLQHSQTGSALCKLL
jgi:hypothetical protein